MVDRALAYFKYEDPYLEEPNIAMSYVEADSNGEERRVSVIDERYISSNVELDLASKAVDYFELEKQGHVTRITKQEFDAVWSDNLKRREADWAKAKEIYPIGAKADGFIKIFFPQGVIVKLQYNTFGVADYRISRASIYAATGGFMATKHLITAKVTGYNEVNQWIILDSPQVHRDRLETKYGTVVKDFLILDTFHARDFDASLAFYTETLNMKQIRRWDRADGKGALILASHRTAFEMYGSADGKTYDGPAPMAFDRGLTWRVDSPEKLDFCYKKLAAAGADFLHEPTDQEWDHRDFYVKDPDGIPIRIYCELPR